MLKKISLGLFCGFILCACDSKRVFDEYKSLKGTWNKDEKVSFSFSPKDTLSTRNLFVNIRNNNDYKFSNLFLIVELNYPNGKSITDTLQYKMAEPNGTFLGSGFGEVKENKLWYRGLKDKFVFNESGTYTISIGHAMRENGQVDGVSNLDGIIDVGFRIESVEN